MKDRWRHGPAIALVDLTDFRSDVIAPGRGTKNDSVVTARGLLDDPIVGFGGGDVVPIAARNEAGKLEHDADDTSGDA